MPNRPNVKSRKKNREARRVLNVAFGRAIEIENRYEPAVARGKDYTTFVYEDGSPATNNREKARRVRQMEKLSLIPDSAPRCDHD